jgi:hypothetical protein
VLAVETARLAQEQAIGERTYEKELFVEKAKITAEEGVSLRDIDRTLSVETSRFGQEQQVQQREIEKNLVVLYAQICLTLILKPASAYRIGEFYEPTESRRAFNFAVRCGEY